EHRREAPRREVRDEQRDADRDRRRDDERDERRPQRAEQQRRDVRPEALAVQQRVLGGIAHERGDRLPDEEEGGRREDDQNDDAGAERGAGERDVTGPLLRADPLGGRRLFRRLLGRAHGVLRVCRIERMSCWCPRVRVSTPVEPRTRGLRGRRPSEETIPAGAGHSVTIASIAVLTCSRRLSEIGALPASSAAICWPSSEATKVKEPFQRW